MFGMHHLWGHPPDRAKHSRGCRYSVHRVGIVCDRSQTEVGQTSMQLVIDKDVCLNKTVCEWARRKADSSMHGPLSDPRAELQWNAKIVDPWQYPRAVGGNVKGDPCSTNGHLQVPGANDLLQDFS
jgi:hypothetical protein